MSLEDKLKALEKSPAFQKKVAEARKAAIKSGKPFGSGNGAGGVVSDETASRKIVDEILEKVDAVIVAKFPHMPNNLFRVYGPFSTEDGFYEYRIFFDPAAIHRRSLYHGGYPDGLENVIALYSHGSEPTKKPVWNNAGLEWDYRLKRQHGEYAEGRHYFIKAGWYVRPDDFLRSCIDILNAEYTDKNIKITLDKKYYP